MTDREMCQQIIDSERGCGSLSFDCQECPLGKDDEWDCGNYASATRAAYAFLKNHPE